MVMRPLIVALLLALAACDTQQGPLREGAQRYTGALARVNARVAAGAGLRTLQEGDTVPPLR